MKIFCIVIAFFVAIYSLNVNAIKIHQSINMLNNIISNVPLPTVGNHAANKTYVDLSTNQCLNDAFAYTDSATNAIGNSFDYRWLNVEGDSMDGVIDMNANTISNLPIPVANDQAATKGYVDSRGNSITQFQKNALCHFCNFVISHDADPNLMRHVQVVWKYYNSQDTDESLDFDLEDESNYVQESDSDGTVFEDGIVKLEKNADGVGTSNIASNKSAFASSGLGPQNVIDGDLASSWYNDSSPSSGEWWAVDLQTTVKVGRVRVSFANYDPSGPPPPVYYAPSNWFIYGSLDSNSWNLITNVFPINNSNWQIFDFMSAEECRFLRFTCQEGWRSDYWGMFELEVFPTIYSFTNTPFYVTTGDNSLDSSDWTNIVSVTVEQDTPTDTSVRWLVSFDGKTTWKYYNSGWQSSSLANLQIDGMAKSELEAITSSQWIEAGGLADQLDFAFDLDTDDGDFSPSVSQISVTYQEDSSWRIDNRGDFRIKMSSPTKTTVKNLSGRTKDIKVNIILPN